MTWFPGLQYAGNGRSLRKGRPDLTIPRMARYPHRGIVSRSPEADVIRVWCLADHATFLEAPTEVLDEGIKFVLQGTAILLLAKRPEVVLDFREMMLASVLIAEDFCRRRVAA